jgi:hypothetical protein
MSTRCTFGWSTISENFPKRIKGLNSDALQVNYEEVKQPENEVISEMQSIMEYALPKFKYSIEEGKELIKGRKKYFNCTHRRFASVQK